jgi:hypothetical protein
MARSDRAGPISLTTANTRQTSTEQTSSVSWVRTDFHDGRAMFEEAQVDGQLADFCMSTQPIAV